MDFRLDHVYENVVKIGLKLVNRSNVPKRKFGARRGGDPCRMSASCSHTSTISAFVNLDKLLAHFGEVETLKCQLEHKPEIDLSSTLTIINLLLSVYHLDGKYFFSWNDYHFAYSTENGFLFIFSATDE